MRSLPRTSQEPPVLLAVIHVTSPEQAIREAVTAYVGGVDGVYLISHGYLQYRALSEVVGLIRAEVLDDEWVGVNYLDINDPVIAMEMALDAGANGLWVDYPGLVEGADRQPVAVRTLDTRYFYREPMLYMGGVAFKGQPPPADDAAMARLATEYMEVVVTSGPGTGLEADVEKIRRMKAAIGDFPLGLASGVTVANVRSYLPSVSYFLVSTGISTGRDMLDVEKVVELAEIIHTYDE